MCLRLQALQDRFRRDVTETLNTLKEETDASFYTLNCKYVKQSHLPCIAHFLIGSRPSTIDHKHSLKLAACCGSIS